MSGLRRLLGFLVLLLATVGFLGCVAGTVGAWMFREKASAKAADVSIKVEAGLKRVSAVNLKVKEALDKARAEVAKVNKESAHLRDEDKHRLTTDYLRIFVRNQVGPKINEVSDRLALVSDAAIAVSSLLESFEELPLAQDSRYHPDKVKRLAELAAQLPIPVQKLEGVLGDSNKTATAADVDAAATEVDTLLQRCQTTVDDWQSDLDAVSKDVRHIEAETQTWLTRGAIIVTVLCAWMALGQISLFAHGVKWCRRD